MTPSRAQRAHAFLLQRPLSAGAVAWVAGGLLALACTFGPVGAQAQPGAAAMTHERAETATHPRWNELKADQQVALLPLAPHWEDLSEHQKRKWLALSRNFHKLSIAEQATLHERMTGWAALSDRERAQARLNFGEVRQIAPDERKAKWEAYQALSEEERHKLAEGAVKHPPGAATPVRPVPLQKLAPAPSPPAAGRHTPRIQLGPMLRPAPQPPVATPHAAPVPTPGKPPSSAP